MVAGADERAIARVVGEVTCGGGTARHAPGALSQAERVQAAIARTLEVFERLDVVVVGDPEVDPRPLARALEGKLTEPTARLLFLYPAPLDRWTGPAPCNAIVWTGGAEADLDNVGELAVFLCSRAAEGITRQTIALSS
jgi:NAD(P)-dependent dehydrogenase (short-subunit alcohol dehydrogenase family)